MTEQEKTDIEYLEKIQFEGCADKSIVLIACTKTISNRLAEIRDALALIVEHSGSPDGA